MAIHVMSTMLPMLQVELRVSATNTVHGRGSHQVTRTALVDTGATITAISPGIKATLQPPVIGNISYHPRVQAAIWVPTYFVVLEIEPHSRHGRTFSLEVIEEQPVTPGVEILLGYDLLHKVVMVWDGPRDKLVLTY